MSVRSLRCVCGTRCVALQLMRVGGWMQVSPKQFVQRLKHDNELFRSFMHQDAHEFLNFLLNDKAQVQIELNETWEEVKCTKKNVSLNLF